MDEVDGDEDDGGSGDENSGDAVCWSRARAECADLCAAAMYALAASVEDVARNDSDEDDEKAERDWEAFPAFPFSTELPVAEAC
mmetsp:Transcript_4013/g.7817  ORF Transcript_4013/g.7817 Transcript_4013/m.7817 type:complete len:84 (+) Transcript_4013:180-431(+)